MSLKTFTFKLTMGIWEGELILKALEKYKPRRNNEKYSKQDLMRHLKRQMEEQKNERTDRTAGT